MRLIIVSNRLPVNIVKTDDGYRYEKSSGGLVSGLGAYTEKRKQNSENDEIIWVGWPGTAVENEEQVSAEIYEKFNARCVFLTEDEMENFYEGFCNHTIWPLFHYFPSYASFNPQHWEQYISVNKRFCDTLKSFVRPGDVIWVHDYHLMLLPLMLRNYFPDISIGFFLHIPFPAYEVFRLLPSAWREEILLGLFGSDLIGFHTHDYRSYFLHSALRILGYANNMGEVVTEKQFSRIDEFPMGIDYEKFSSAVYNPEIIEEEKLLMENFKSVKLIISIDRQDYTKGILNRLLGFEYFLSKHPSWKEKISLVMIVVPSRIGVKNYQETKSKIDELTGRINGTYGSMTWAPVIYQYRSVTFSELIALYHGCDIALVTPLRDGMNLVAKEFIATRDHHRGVLILSEMAGAADELSESIIINPNNIEEIGDAIARALSMKTDDQAMRIRTMQERIREYDVFNWAEDFLTSLQRVKDKQQRLKTRMLPQAIKNEIAEQFRSAENRTLILDYDGTLIPFANRPEAAYPGPLLLQLLQRLSSLKNTEIIIVSGRDRYTLDHWFAHLPVHLAAEHGLLLKESHKKWKMLKPVRKHWKKKILPIMKMFTTKLPGSFIEEKDYSIVFHYRKSRAEVASFRVKELMDYLINFTANMDVQVVEGDKNLEVRNAGVDKGLAVMNFFSGKKKKSHFIMAIGDDKTDEDLFRALPAEAYSIKVGLQASYAKYNLLNTQAVFDLLSGLSLNERILNLQKS